jgi:hypothetical protein
LGVSYLKLVRDRTGVPDLARPKFEEMQESLLPARERTIAICTADGLKENVLRALVDTLNPRLVVDLRTTPRFDFGSLNRGKVLDLFASISALYLDAGSGRSQGIPDADELAQTICEHVIQLEKEAPTSAALVLLNSGENYERIGLCAISKLRQRSKNAWEMLLFGPTWTDDLQRRLIFISHANPEDNEIVLWLQAQLSRQGYETWADLSNLSAGETFWDTIEDTIRNKAARFIALISRKSLQKPSVLDEISLAISIERARNLGDFVIPIRVDDIPFSDFRANLARKNVVDFSTSWSSGLSALSAALVRDRIPRQRQIEGLSLADWWEKRRSPTLSVRKESEVLTSNRFLLSAIPSRVYSYSGTPELQIASPNPLTQFRGRYLAFASERELANLGIKGLQQESVLSSEDLFAGNISQTSHIHPAARLRLRHGMLNRQWLAFLHSRGLKSYELTGLQPTPFFPDGLIAGNTARFSDAEGKQRKRLVVGFSDKRRLYWHLAPAGSFSTARSTTLNLKLRVLFSVDGHSEWPSVERMRTMRRAFCKNWWNDRWISLQLAFMSWLSSGSPEVLVYKGDGGVLALKSTAISFESPLSIHEIHTNVETEVDSEVELNRALDDLLIDDLETDDDFPSLEVST